MRSRSTSCSAQSSASPRRRSCRITRTGISRRRTSTALPPSGPSAADPSALVPRAILGELGEHLEIELALERHDQLGQPLGRDPFPGVELGMLGGGGVDIAILAGKAHREPFLPLAAVA